MKLPVDEEGSASLNSLRYPDDPDIVPPYAPLLMDTDYENYELAYGPPLHYEPFLPAEHFAYPCNVIEEGLFDGSIDDAYGMDLIDPNLIQDLSSQSIQQTSEDKQKSLTEETSYHPHQDHCYAGVRPPTPEIPEDTSTNDFEVPESVFDDIPVDLQVFQGGNEDNDDDDDDDDESIYDEPPMMEEKCKKPKSKSLPLVAMPEESIDVWNENDSCYPESPVKKKSRNVSTTKSHTFSAKRTSTVRDEPYSRKIKTSKSTNTRLKPTSSDVENALKAPRGRTRKTKHYTKKSDKGSKRIDHNELEKERRTQQRDLLNKLHKSIPIKYFKPDENNTKKHSKQSILQAARKCVAGLEYESNELNYSENMKELLGQKSKLLTEYMKIYKTVAKIVGWKD